MRDDTFQVWMLQHKTRGTYLSYGSERGTPMWWWLRREARTAANTLIGGIDWQPVRATVTVHHGRRQ